ncbi:MAG: tetratricopeptide repeat protein [Proteobacteria bacterium]|nr:tetratricopeptide repeat protein [Pseudomonadota bacterium]MBU4130852.1 tetratricopeptide repeat protein [Pseudomonadota bacterium]
MLGSAIKWIFLSFLATGLLFACGGNSRDEAENYIESARDFVARKKPETAVIEYKNALEYDPQNDVALFELAETYVLLNKVNTAIRYYNLSSLANPVRIEPHLRLAQIYSKTDRLMEARSQISQAMTISPKSVNAYHILSGIQIREKDLESAVNTLKQAQIIEPSNVKTLVSLAQLYVKTKQIELAKSAYGQAISYDSSSRVAYMGLARLYALEKKWDSIEELLVSVSQKPGNTSQKYGDLAGFYEQQQKNDLAKDYYERAVESGSGQILPVMALAKFYTKMNQMSDAVAILETALNQKQHLSLVLTGLSQIYLQFNEIDKAESTVDRALAKDKNYVDAVFQKGRVLMARQEYKKALDHFDQVIAMNKIYAKAFYFRALCIKERGASDRPEQKIFRAAAGMLDKPQEFEQNQIKENLLAALTIDPGLFEARMALASHYLFEKRADKAKQEVGVLLKQKAPDHQIMSLVAGINVVEGNMGEAEKIFLAIISENPDYLPAYVRLGFLYKENGKPADAMVYFQKAFERNPLQLGLADEIIGLNLKAEQYEKAIALTDHLSALAGEGAAAYFYNKKGEIYLKMGKVDSGISYFSKSIVISPLYIRPQMNLAGFWSREKATDKALEHYQAVEKIDPHYIPALFAIAQIYDAAHGLELAQKYYRKVLLINPRHPIAANNLAFLLSEQKEGLEEAFKLAKMAREIRPDDPNVLDTMGWIYYQKGNYFSALSEIEDSLGKEPDSPLANFHYGMALYRTKSYEKAREFFKKALALDPHFRGARDAREMLN